MCGRRRAASDPGPGTGAGCVLGVVRLPEGQIRARTGGHGSEDLYPGSPGHVSCCLRRGIHRSLHSIPPSHGRRCSTHGRVCGKFTIVRRFAYLHTEFDEPMDGIVYAAAAALGLATLENVLYVFSAYLTSPPLRSSTVIARAIFSVPGHALFAGVWGYALGQARSRPPRSDPPSSVGGSFWDGGTAYSISCSSPQKSSLMPWPRSSWS